MSCLFLVSVVTLICEIFHRLLFFLAVCYVDKLSQAGGVLLLEQAVVSIGVNKNINERQNPEKNEKFFDLMFFLK